MSLRPGINGNGGTAKFSIQRIPPSHDYIRRDGAGPKDGWAKGPADPGPAPTAPDTRPPKKREQAAGRHTNHPAESTGDGAADDHTGGGVPFVHLHVHSNFSFLDGGSRIEALVAQAAELGQPALALTDHDGLYGAVRLAKACTKAGIKPIFGAEVRMESLRTDDDHRDSRELPVDPPPDPHHLVLLAETREGYANLCRVVSAAHLADPDRERPPLVTIESLRRHREGIICLTGCRHGQVGYLVDSGRDRDASTVLLCLRELFGSHHLFVELQYFGYEPHQEAHAGQHGAPVYEKIRAEGNRLRHRTAITPSAPSTATITGAVTAVAAPVDGYCSNKQKNLSATLVASWRSYAEANSADNLPHHPDPTRDPTSRGQPQRLNPSDYDVGFHRDGRPWRLSCLTYCERLARLAHECDVATVLTTNAHYAVNTIVPSI